MPRNSPKLTPVFPLFYTPTTDRLGGCFWSLFATSHSIEFLDHFLNSLYGEDAPVAEEDFVRVFTLSPRDNGSADVWPLSGQEAYEKRHKYGLEIR